MSRVSLRLRLALAGAAAVLLSLGLAAAGLAALFGAHVERRAIAELSVQLDQVIAGLARDAYGRLSLARPPADPRFARPLGGLYWQIDGPEGPLRSRSLWDTTLPLPADALPTGAAHAHRLPGPAGGTLLVLERRVTLPERLGAPQVRAAVAMDAAELSAARDAFLRDLAPYLALLALVLSLAGWVQVTVGLRPLSTVGGRVAAVRSGRARRLGSDFPAEVHPLAAEVDALIAARERDVERARARAGDLAHGLKTPLQALLGEAGRLRQKGEAGAADSLEDLARTMQRHLDRELARTRLAARAGAAQADLAETARRVASVVQRTPAGARLEWHLDVPNGLVAALDPGDLTEALGALVENAARHADSEVRILAAGADGTVRLTVRDDGAGIPPDRIEALTQRGARADERRTGLGLAIAREIAEAAGGSLRLANAAPGLAADLRLPAAEASGGTLPSRDGAARSPTGTASRPSTPPGAHRASDGRPPPRGAASEAS